MKNLLNLARDCDAQWSDSQELDWNEAYAIIEACADLPISEEESPTLFALVKDISADHSEEDLDSGLVAQWPIMILDAAKKDGLVIEPQIYKVEMTFTYSSDCEENMKIQNLWIYANHTEDATTLAESWSEGKIEVSNECFAVKPLSASDVSSLYDGDTESVEVTDLVAVNESMWSLTLTTECYTRSNSESFSSEAIASYDVDSLQSMMAHIETDISLECFDIEEVDEQSEYIFMTWGGLTVRVGLSFNHEEYLLNCSAEKIQNELLQELYKSLIAKKVNIEPSPSSNKASQTVLLEDVYESDSSMHVTVASSQHGIFLTVQGYGNSSMENGKAFVLGVENRGGELRAMAWTDYES
ncbi:MAG: hypothetical protein EOP04_03670, partial [Proteobacteria bacterium]